MIMSVDLEVTGISYRDSSRISEFRSLLQQIDESLKVSHSLVLWQPEVPVGEREKRPVILWADMYFTRIGYRKMFRKLESILGTPLRTRLIREAAFLIKLPLVLQYLVPKYRRLRTELRSREAFLNSKHRLAWSKFLEGTCDLLLVLEDDVRPTDHLWKERLLEAVSTAGNLTSSPAILNMAPFFDLRELLPELSIQSDLYNENWQFFHFYANTTAAYIINRPAAEELLTGFINEPKYCLESIDFAMTMVSLNAGLNFEYLERNPIVFQNSSQVEGASSLGN